MHTCMCVECVGMLHVLTGHVHVCVYMYNVHIYRSGCVITFGHCLHKNVQCTVSDQPLYVQCCLVLWLMGCYSVGVVIVHVLATREL